MQHSCDLSLSLAKIVCQSRRCWDLRSLGMHSQRIPYSARRKALPMPPLEATTGARWPARISATQHVLHAHQQHSMTCMHFSNTACPARTSATQHDLHAHQQHSRVGSGPDFYSPNCIATILPKLVRRRKDRTVHHSISKGVRLRQRQKAACSASKTQPALLQAAATSLLHTRALLKAPRCIYV